MSARSGADEEVSDKPFTVQALLRATARPCRVSERSNLRLLLENSLVANFTCYQKKRNSERGGKDRKAKFYIPLGRSDFRQASVRYNPSN